MMNRPRLRFFNFAKYIGKILLISFLFVGLLHEGVVRFLDPMPLLYLFVDVFPPDAVADDEEKHAADDSDHDHPEYHWRCPSFPV